MHPDIIDRQTLKNWSLIDHSKTLMLPFFSLILYLTAHSIRDKSVFAMVFFIGIICLWLSESFYNNTLAKKMHAAMKIESVLKIMLPAGYILLIAGMVWRLLTL